MEKYKFYSTDRLCEILDENKLSDHRTENFIRAVLLGRYKRACEVINVSPTEDESDPYFSRSGCDCCGVGKATNIYKTSGYSKKHKEILLTGDICHECLCVEVNGIN